MSYFQRHLRNGQNNEIQNRVARQPPNQANALKIVKNNDLRVKTQHSILEPNTKRSKYKDSSRVSIQPEPRKSNQLQKPIKAVKCQSQGPKRPTRNESLDQPMRAILAQTDNSVQQMLNSSIKHFQKLLANQSRLSDEHSHIVQQNEYLKVAVNQLRYILQQKLETALKKQKQELGLVMSDYLCLITKLLADKEQLTVSVENAEEQIHKLRMQGLSSKRQIQTLRNKQLQLNRLNQSISNHLEIIQSQKMEQKQQQVFQRLKNQESKIKTLYELLERTQNEKKVLQQAFCKLQKADDKYKLLEDEYLAKLQEIQKEHEEQFLEYQKAVRQTIAKKDETIQRLNQYLSCKMQELQDSRLIISKIV